MKPEKKEAARDLFDQTSINISTQGKKHLGAVLGSRSYLKEYVIEKVDDWVNWPGGETGRVCSNPTTSLLPSV